MALSSMKLFKPSYSYGATKSNYSESHQEYSDSAWAGKAEQPSYNYQAHENHMGLNDAYGRASANNSTNYYAQAQCAQPSPSVNVVQSTHVVESMKRQESLKGEQLGVGSPKCPSPAQSGRPEFGMQHEEHMMGKTDMGWAKKPDYISGVAQESQYGLGMHKEEHVIGKTEQGWANKPTQCSSPRVGSQHGIVVHEEEHIIGKVESGVVQKPTQFSSPYRANQYGPSMYNEEHGDAYNYGEGGVEKAWATKPTNYMGPNQLSPIRTNNTGFGFHKEDSMIGKIDQGWANSPTKFSSPQSNHSSMGMYEGEHVMGKMGHRPNIPTNFSGPIKTSDSGLQMYKEEHVMGKNDLMVNSANGGWAKPANQPVKYSGANQLGHSGHNMYKEQGQLGYGASQVNLSAHGVAQNGFGAAQVNHSAYGGSQNRYGAAQPNHSAHGVAQNGFGSAEINHSIQGIAQNGYRAEQVNHSAHGVAQNGFGSGQANHFVDGVTQNGYGAGQFNHSAYGVAQNRYGSAQVNQSVHGVAQNGYGAAQAHYSAHGAYNYQDEDHEECDEGLHDIVDEILTKYPAHNISGSHGNSWAAKQSPCVGPNQVTSSYANGPAKHGIVAQSSSNKFEMKKEVKAGYMGNMKEEYSRSSSSNKFGVNGLMNNGGLCTNRVETEVECDF